MTRKTCDVAATEIFYCDDCAAPIIASTAERCPICGGRTRRLAKDVRPVFPEEKILLAHLLNKPTDFFMSRTLFATGSRYFIDGKSLSVPAKKFAAAARDDDLAAKISAADVAAGYVRFTEDAQKFVRVNRYRLAELTEEAGNFVRDTAENFSDEQIIISFSGGKDSTVTADIVTRALSNPSIVHVFGNSTLEFPTTLEYVARYRARHPLAIFNTTINADQNFFDVCRDIGPPARMRRWCCSMFKTGPIARLLYGLYRDEKILTFYGVRKCESVIRSKYNRVEADAASIKIRRQTVASPIFFWKDADVWLYLLAEGIDFNAAYRLGYDRVGCWCCPNNNQRAQFLSRIYMPQESRAWREFLIDFAKKIGKPDAQAYVDGDKWKARQGGNGLPAAVDVKLEVTTCAGEAHAKIYRLRRPFSAELVGLFVPFGKIAPDLGNETLHETLILDLQSDKPIISIVPVDGGNAVKITTLRGSDHANLQRKAGYQIRKFNACRKCLKCESLCKVGAISVGTSYRIDAMRCVHCGVCTANKFLAGGCMMHRFLQVK